MILVVSKFRVRGEDVQRVQQAFVRRPRRVEVAFGFQGMEVFNDSADPNLFCLVTRWSDLQSYRRWHSSEEHHLSHAEIPKGIHLDPAFTKVEILSSIEGAGGTGLRARVPEWELLLGHYLENGNSIFVLADLPEGRIVECNVAFAATLGREREDLLGFTLWDHMPESEVPRWRNLTSRCGTIAESGRRLNLVDASSSPKSFLCAVQVQPGRMAILAWRERQRRNSRDDLIRINNELAVISRESSRRRLELERANSALRTTARSLQELAVYLTNVRDQERRELQHTLHEGVAQTVAAAAMELSRASKSGRSDAVEGALELIRESCAELRRLATDLHPPGLQVFGLANTLEDWADRYRESTGVFVNLNLRPQALQLPPSLQFEVFRLIQEAADCIAEAGVRAVTVWLRSNRYRTRGVIEGKGFVNSGAHKMQFAAIETRARKLGGIAGYFGDADSMKLHFSLPQTPMDSGNPPL